MTLTRRAAELESEFPTAYVFWNGLRPDGFENQRKGSDQIWPNDLPALMRMRAHFPPYAPQGILGDWAYAAIESANHLGWSMRGSWILPLLFVVGFIGLWRRDRAGILFISLPSLAPNWRPLSRDPEAHRGNVHVIPSD